MRLRMIYTCADYRFEMKLLGLKKRLHEENLSEAERVSIIREIEQMEKAIEID